jgi:hypothetical protein
LLVDVNSAGDVGLKDFTDEDCLKLTKKIGTDQEGKIDVNTFTELNQKVGQFQELVVQ